MANPKHLERLKQGVEAWNRWRKDNPEEKPNLSGANLSKADLNEADLSRSNLSGANFSKADLIEADLTRSNLKGANFSKADLSRGDLRSANIRGANLSNSFLMGANLSWANLSKADLSRALISGAKLIKADLNEADLNEADLSWANLSWADFSRSNLSGINLTKADLKEADLNGANLLKADLSWANLLKANLSKANLNGANLIKTDLNEADLNEADLSWANLTKADLSGAYLNESNLRRANLTKSYLSESYLSGANLTKADLRGAILIKAILCRTDISGSLLYGTARDDWNIQGIRCDYLFWDKDGIIRTPKKGNFKPGEFERLCTSLPTIEYFFKNGMAPLDLVAMDGVVESIKKEHPEFELQIASVNARGINQSVELTIKSPEYSENALELLTVKYETKIKQLEGERDRLYKLIKRKMDQPDKINLIEAQPGSFVTNDGSSINIEQYVNHLEKIERDIKEASQENLSDTLKRTALDIVGETLKDVAKGQVKGAAQKIVELGKDIVPFIVDTAAYGFFKGLLG